MQRITEPTKDYPKRFTNPQSPLSQMKDRKRLHRYEVNQRRNNGIVVPEWLDFEPCRTRYIKAQKAYIKLCHR